MSAPTSPRGALIGGWLALVLLVTGLGTWSLCARIGGALIAPGQVAVARNRLVVQHPEGGVIARLTVTEGDRVVAGQLLARLDGRAAATEKAIVDARYWELLARRARLTAERDAAKALTPPAELAAEARRAAPVATLVEGQRALFAARLATLRQEDAQLAEQQAQAGAQIAGIDAQSAALSRQRNLIGSELQTQRSLLVRGLAHSSRVLELEREAARMDGSLGALAAQRAETEGKRAEISIARTRLLSQRREAALTELRDLDEKITELDEQRRALADRLSRLDLRAPAGGIVQGLTLTTPRAVLKPAEPLLSIVPQDRPLVVTTEIAPIDIDAVRPGQPVRLRLTAFDARTTPELAAHLTRVSPDAFHDPGSGRAFYLAEIALDPGQVSHLPGPLVPGMPVEAFIATGARSPAAYLVKPFADYLARAFRDG